MASPQPSCPAPNNFRSAGSVHKARFVCETPQFADTPVPSRGSFANGARYEARAQAHLLANYPDNYVPSPWIQFATQTGLRYCQPDGLFFDLPRAQLTIIEIKLKHTARAWWQLQRLYLPVVKEIFPAHCWHYSLLEVCCWLDPSEPFPTTYDLIDEPYLSPPGHFGVMTWRN